MNSLMFVILCCCIIGKRSDSFFISNKVLFIWSKFLVGSLQIYSRPPRLLPNVLTRPTTCVLLFRNPIKLIALANRSPSLSKSFTLFELSITRTMAMLLDSPDAISSPCTTGMTKKRAIPTATRCFSLMISLLSSRRRLQSSC